MPGSQSSANLVKLLTKVPSDTDINWRNSGVNIPPGTPVYNSTTRELKIGIGALPFHQTPNHEHPDQYSGLGHEHMGGFQEKWFRSMPRLVHRNALALYPELVPLDGTYVTDQDKVDGLSPIYSGTTQINPVVTTGDQSVVKVTSTPGIKDNFYAWNIFNNPLTVENAHWTSDQWVTADGTTACSLVIEFVGAPTYLFEGYDIVSRLATADAPYIMGPSPKDWVVKGSLDGTTWFDIEPFADQPEWQPGEARSYDNPEAVEVKFIKFDFTEWYPGTNAELTPGLKRLYLYGKRIDGFAMPNVPAPQDFVYAVPYKDLGIGMKHEEIGDIVYVASDVKVTPINRVPVDGRVLKKNIEPDLFDVIQHNYDTQNNLDGVTATTVAPHSVSVVNGEISWNSTATDTEAVIEYIDMAGVIGLVSMYDLYPKPDGSKPTHWLFEGFDGEVWHTLHDRSFDPDTEVYGQFKLQILPDALNIQKYRISVIAWEGAGTIGLSRVKLYTHDLGYYRIPTMVFDPTDQTIPHIVTRVRTEDVNSGIVLRLQNSLARALELISTLESRVTTLEIQLARQE